MVAFKECHLRVKFSCYSFLNFTRFPYDRSPAIAHEYWDVSTAMRFSRTRVISILIKRVILHFRARTISSLARTSGRVYDRTPRAILRSVKRTPPPSTSSSSRQHYVSRGRIYKRACRHVPELISYFDEVIRFAQLFSPSENKATRNRDLGLCVEHTRCAQAVFNLAGKFPWRYHRVWPTFDHKHVLANHRYLSTIELMVSIIILEAIVIIDCSIEKNFHGPMCYQRWIYIQ